MPCPPHWAPSWTPRSSGSRRFPAPQRQRNEVLAVPARSSPSKEMTQKESAGRQQAPDLRAGALLSSASFGFCSPVTRAWQHSRCTAVPASPPISAAPAPWHVCEGWPAAQSHPKPRDPLPLQAMLSLLSCGSPRSSFPNRVSHWLLLGLRECPGLHLS